MGPPCLLQSVPNYSLTYSKWSLITVAVSRTCLQGSLHSWSRPYQKRDRLSSRPLRRCFPEMAEGSDAISTALPLCTCCTWLTVPRHHFVSMGHCTEASLLNERQISLVSQSWRFLRSAALGFRNFSWMLWESDFFLLPAIILLSLGLRDESIWIGQKGGRISEAIIFNSPQASLCLLHLCKTFSTKLGP